MLLYGRGERDRRCAVLVSPAQFFDLRLKRNEQPQEHEPVSRRRRYPPAYARPPRCYRQDCRGDVAWAVQTRSAWGKPRVEIQVLTGERYLQR